MSVQLQEEAGGKLLVVKLSGKLPGRNTNHFVPVVERLIGQHGKLRMLVEMDDFHGWTLGKDPKQAEQLGATRSAESRQRGDPSGLAELTFSGHPEAWAFALGCANAVGYVCGMGTRIGLSPGRGTVRMKSPGFSPTECRSEIGLEVVPGLPGGAVGTAFANTLMPPLPRRRCQRAGPGNWLAAGQKSWRK